MEMLGKTVAISITSWKDATAGSKILLHLHQFLPGLVSLFGNTILLPA